MLRPTFVIPWYGRQVPGGAETFCRNLAQNLARRGLPVEVLTTTLGGLSADWDRSAFPPGETREEGVLVRRFAFDPRQAALFHLLNRWLLEGRRLNRRQEQAFLENMVNSRAMYQFIREAGRSPERLFLPLPYLFSTTWRTLETAPGRTVPIACLHDESYAYLDLVRQAFLAAPAVAFLSRPELELARDIWGLPPGRTRLTGVGLDQEPLGQAEIFRAKYQISSPFILYAGRRDRTKNTPLLMDLFRAYKQARGRAAAGLKLVLIGNQPVILPPGMEKEIIDLGFLEPGDKADAFAAARVFCQPSVNESFSMVIMEAWLNSTPVLVHRRCPVTRDHVETSGGGLTFAGEGDFLAALDFLLSDDRAAAEMARQGREYVLANYTWDKICGRFINLFEEVQTWPSDRRLKRLAPASSGPRVLQVIGRLDSGTDVGLEALAISRRLARVETRGALYAAGTEAGVRRKARPLERLRAEIGPEDLLLWHLDPGRPEEERVAEALSGLSGPLAIRIVRPLGRLPVPAGEDFPALDLLRRAASLARWVLPISAGEGSRLQKIGFDRVVPVPLVTLPQDLGGHSPPGPAGPPWLLFLPAGGRPRELDLVLKAFLLLGRLSPEAGLKILSGREEDLVRLRVELAGRRADLKGVETITPNGPEEQAEALASARLVSAFGSAPETSWVIAQASAMGRPVLDLAGLGGPAEAAESFHLLLSDGPLNRELAEAQREEWGGIGSGGPDRGWTVLAEVLSPFLDRPFQDRTDRGEG